MFFELRAISKVWPLQFKWRIRARFKWRIRARDARCTWPEPRGVQGECSMHKYLFFVSDQGGLDPRLRQRRSLLADARQPEPDSAHLSTSSISKLPSIAPSPHPDSVPRLISSLPTRTPSPPPRPPPTHTTQIDSDRRRLFSRRPPPTSSPSLPPPPWLGSDPAPSSALIFLYPSPLPSTRFLILYKRRSAHGRTHAIAHERTHADVAGR